MRCASRRRAGARLAARSAAKLVLGTLKNRGGAAMVEDVDENGHPCPSCAGCAGEGGWNVTDDDGVVLYWQECFWCEGVGLTF